MYRFPPKIFGILATVAVLAGCSGTPSLQGGSDPAMPLALTVPTATIIADARPGLFPVTSTAIRKPAAAAPYAVPPRPVAKVEQPALIPSSRSMVDTGPYTAAVPASAPPAPEIVPAVYIAESVADLPVPTLEPVIETVPVMPMQQAVPLYEPAPIPEPAPAISRGLPYGTSF